MINFFLQTLINLFSDYYDNVAALQFELFESQYMYYVPIQYTHIVYRTNIKYKRSSHQFKLQTLWASVIVYPYLYTSKNVKRVYIIIVTVYCLCRLTILQKRTSAARLRSSVENTDVFKRPMCTKGDGRTKRVVMAVRSVL